MELGQVSFPEVERLDCVARMLGAIDLEEMFRYGDGCRASDAGRRLKVH
jgi:hypothetical protein